MPRKVFNEKLGLIRLFKEENSNSWCGEAFVFVRIKRERKRKGFGFYPVASATRHVGYVTRVQS